MAERITALRIHPRDNVATCVLAQRAGEAAAYEADGEAVTVRLLDDVPFGTNSPSGPSRRATRS